MLALKKPGIRRATIRGEVTKPQICSRGAGDGGSSAWACYGALLLLTVVCACGCGSMQRQPREPLTAGTETSTVTDPMVVVELRDGNDDREYLRAPLKESMLVQDALEGSGAINRFHRMDIVLVRNVSGGEKLRLPIRLDTSTRRVASETNYALHGGDWLEVTEDTSTTFDRMIEGALQPLEPMMRTYR